MKEIKVERKPMEDTIDDPNDILWAIILVDDDDYESLVQYDWYLKKDNANNPDEWHYSVCRQAKKYYRSYKKRSLVGMTRQIMRLDGVKSKPQVNVKDSSKLGPNFDKQRDAWVFDFRKDKLSITGLDGHELRAIHEYWEENMVSAYVSPR